VAPAKPISGALVAVLLHPTNHRIDASTGCGQPVHRTNSAPCCHEDRVREGPWSGLRPLECAPANTFAPLGGRCKADPKQMRTPARGKAITRDSLGTTSGRGWIGDANAPPVRSPKAPHAPSSDVVGALFARKGHRRFSAKSAAGGQARTRSVQDLHAAPTTHSPGGGVRLPDRSAARGDVGGGVPQPTGSSTAGRPTRDPWKRSPGGRRRAHGRAHSHTAGARCNRPYFRTDHNPAIRNNAP
jgi:hypothetical protein